MVGVELAAASEATPLLESGGGSFSFGLSDEQHQHQQQVSSGAGTDTDPNSDSLATREKIYLILEGRYKAVGPIYEKITVFLIVASIAAFVLGSLFDTDYNGDAPYSDMCGKICDAIFFGNDPDNGECAFKSLYTY